MDRRTMTDTDFNPRDNLMLQAATERRLNDIVNNYRPSLPAELIAAINQHITATARCTTDLERLTT